MRTVGGKPGPRLQCLAIRFFASRGRCAARPRRLLPTRERPSIRAIRAGEHGSQAAKAATLRQTLGHTAPRCLRGGVAGTLTEIKD
ncbi:hypothetical protein BOS5A_180123 [Bosea sp. EC-HK365B]|nr:hypothetical protein BOSE21B_80039 [Bosea sp. 21B]CAD5300168.1 hypothetical protein BOSE7B_60769 [Bosea sp. 7B]VVT57239.1 hypothetical protein BOS5A_180123 [Bosea sp. EC-HK365B]VXB51568.1 hypothetical protein BOSE127_120233 [Bosea sp. 127]